MYKPYWAHLNQIGAPVRLTDADGAVVWAAEYEPFGKTVSLDEDPDGDGEAVTMNFRFPGQYYDSETGLHYNWHRYYDPTAGRYLQAEQDNIYKTKNINKLILISDISYSYSYNDPLIFFDYTGNSTFWETAETTATFGLPMIAGAVIGYSIDGLPGGIAGVFLGGSLGYIISSGISLQNIATLLPPCIDCWQHATDEYNKDCMPNDGNDPNSACFRNPDNKSGSKSKFSYVSSKCQDCKAIFDEFGKLVPTGH